MSKRDLPPLAVFAFAVLVLSLAGMLYLYVGWGMAVGQESTRWVRWARGALVLQFCCLPLVFICSRYGRRSRSMVVLYWVAYLGLGITWLVSLGFLLRDGIRWVLASWGDSFFLVTGNGAAFSTFFVLGAVALLGIRGVYNASRRPNVCRVRVGFTELSPGLEGFRIVQISDLHIGQTLGEEWLAGIVETVNALDADLVAITGDLVDGPVQEIGSLVRPLSNIVARHGVYFVTGNHEYYYGAESWVEAMEDLGICVLLNSNRVLELGESRLLVAGVADWTAGQFVADHACNPAQAALVGSPVDLKVLLAHQPCTASQAAEAGFDLQLSGHTHGGQIFPFHLLVPLQQPYRAGLHVLGNLRIYVSRGTGYWGPPIRLGAPSEISVLEFSREASSTG